MENLYIVVRSDGLVFGFENNFFRAHQLARHLIREKKQLFTVLNQALLKSYRNAGIVWYQHEKPGLMTRF